MSTRFERLRDAVTKTCSASVVAEATSLHASIAHAVLRELGNEALEDLIKPSRVVIPVPPAPPQLTPEQEVWMRAWAGVASAPNCYSPDSATKWADKCLEAYKRRFP